MIYSDLEREFDEKQANVQLLEKEIDQVNKEIGEVQ
ncbi:unnamed protein product, partial [Rotaria sp. Silwood1]